MSLIVRCLDESSVAFRMKKARFSGLLYVRLSNGDRLHLGGEKCIFHFYR